jgi:hypothetical protein
MEIRRQTLQRGKQLIAKFKAQIGRTTMNMKKHILTALREEFNHWEESLASLSGEQITNLRVLDEWSTKDVITHLWAWQQISVARLEAALSSKEPKFPKWVAELQADWEEDANLTNAHVHEIYHEHPWSKIYKEWRTGFLKLLELGDEIPEKDLLDSGKYAWLKGYSLANVLIASYDHHQEHIEKLIDWLRKHDTRKVVG